MSERRALSREEIIENKKRAIARLIELEKDMDGILTSYANTVYQAETGEPGQAETLNEAKRMISSIEARDDIEVASGDKNFARAELQRFGEMLQNKSNSIGVAGVERAKKVVGAVTKTVFGGALGGATAFAGALAVPEVFGHISNYLQSLSPEIAESMRQLANRVIPPNVGITLLASAGFGAALYCGGKSLWLGLKKIAEKIVDRNTHNYRIATLGELERERIQGDENMHGRGSPMQGYRAGGNPDFDDDEPQFDDDDPDFG